MPSPFAESTIERLRANCKGCSGERGAHLGLEYHFLESLSAFTRIQHMSNAGIYSENPGVNLMMIGLRYRF